MTLKDYILSALDRGYPKKSLWIRSMFSIPQESNEFLILNDTYEIPDFGKTSIPVTQPLFSPTDTLVLPKDSIFGNTEEIKTTVGRVVLNYLMFYVPLGKRVPFINHEFTYNDISQQYIVPFVKNDDEATDADIPLSKYRKILSSLAYLRQFANVLVVPTTEKTFYPPEEVLQYRDQLFKEYTKQYGKDFSKDKALVLEFENKLLAKLKEYLKDDPTLGITLTGKNLNQSLKKIYLSIGITEKMSDDQEDINILSSLSEGYPKEKKALSAIFNNIRFGSAGRALETKDSGLLAKILIRATHSFKISQDDCGNKDTYRIKVLKENIFALKTLYVKVNGKWALQEESYFKDKVGKYLDFRTPLYCKSPGDTICKYCAGTLSWSNPNVVPLITIGLGGDMLKHSLSKFHATSYSLKTFSPTDLI